MSPSVPDVVRRNLARLDPADPLRAMVELIFEVEEPAVTSAILRRLLAEIADERKI